MCEHIPRRDDRGRAGDRRAQTAADERAQKARRAAKIYARGRGAEPAGVTVKILVYMCTDGVVTADAAACGQTTVRARSHPLPQLFSYRCRRLYTFTPLTSPCRASPHGGGGLTRVYRS